MFERCAALTPPKLATIAVALYRSPRLAPLGIWRYEKFTCRAAAVALVGSIAALDFAR